MTSPFTAIGNRTVVRRPGDAPSLTAQQVIERLTYIRRATSPREALTAALGMREELTPRLLEELGLAPADVEARTEVEPDDGGYYHLHSIAIFLLGQWREPRAWPLILDYFCSDSNLADDLTGDDLGDDLPAILVRCYDGSDLAALERIIATDAFDNLFRYECLRAFHGLVITGRAPRDRLVGFVETLLAGPPYRGSAEWYGWLAWAAAEIKEPRLRQPIEALFDRGAINDRMFCRVIDKEGIADVYAQSADETDDDILRAERMDDVVEVICHWYWFRPVVPWLPALPVESWLQHKASQPVARAGPKVGRNDPCPCGSGKKYKKCCLES